MRLVVIAGPANTGKMPLARRMMAEDPALVLVHRDYIRDAIVTKIDEWEITLLMGAMTDRLLGLGHSVIVVAWNLEPADHALWYGLSCEYFVEFEWLDVRKPAVAAMIPPMENANAENR